MRGLVLAAVAAVGIAGSAEAETATFDGLTADWGLGGLGAASLAYHEAGFVFDLGTLDPVPEYASPGELGFAAWEGLSNSFTHASIYGEAGRPFTIGGFDIGGSSGREFRYDIFDASGELVESGASGLWQPTLLATAHYANGSSATKWLNVAPDGATTRLLNDGFFSTLSSLSLTMWEWPSVHDVACLGRNQPLFGSVLSSLLTCDDFSAADGTYVSLEKGGYFVAMSLNYASAANASIDNMDIATVPIPPAAPLLAAGVAALTMFRKRHRKAA